MATTELPPCVCWLVYSGFMVCRFGLWANSSETAHLGNLFAEAENQFLLGVFPFATKCIVMLPDWDSSLTDLGLLNCINAYIYASNWSSACIYASEGDLSLQHFLSNPKSQRAGVFSVLIMIYAIALRDTLHDSNYAFRPQLLSWCTIARYFTARVFSSPHNTSTNDSSCHLQCLILLWRGILRI